MAIVPGIRSTRLALDCDPILLDCDSVDNLICSDDK